VRDVSEMLDGNSQSATRKAFVKRLPKIFRTIPTTCAVEGCKNEKNVGHLCQEHHGKELRATGTRGAWSNGRPRLDPLYYMLDGKVLHCSEGPYAIDLARRA
jgi:hypothetical protein